MLEDGERLRTERDDLTAPLESSVGRIQREVEEPKDAGRALAHRRGPARVLGQNDRDRHRKPDFRKLAGISQDFAGAPALHPVAMRRSPHGPLRPDRAFLVQLGAESGGRRRLNGRIEHVVSGASEHFDSLGALLDFMERHAAPTERDDSEP